MSDTAALATTPLTDAERADVRRFCGYSIYGLGASGFVGDRFYVAYGDLEYRMTNAAPAELQVIRNYLAALYAMEAAIPGAGANLDTDQAAVWFHNKNEVRDRRDLFDDWRRRLCDDIGVPYGPGLRTPGVTLVV